MGVDQVVVGSFEQSWTLLDDSLSYLIFPGSFLSIDVAVATINSTNALILRISIVERPFGWLVNPNPKPNPNTWYAQNEYSISATQRVFFCKGIF